MTETEEKLAAMIIAGARALDKFGLEAIGWRDDEITKAMRSCNPSPIGLKHAEVVIRAVLGAPPISGKGEK